MLVTRVDILLADLRYLASDTGALNLSGVLLVGTCTVQLWKLQLEKDEGGPQKWGPHGCCKMINHLSLAVVQTPEYSRTSPFDKYVQETKEPRNQSNSMINSYEDKDCKNNAPTLSHVVQEQLLYVEGDGDHRSSPTPKSEREMAGFWGWEQRAGPAMEQKLMQSKDLEGEGAMWPGEHGSNLAFGQIHLFSCGNSGYNTGPRLHLWAWRSESRVQHQEIKLAAISILFHFKVK